MNHAVIISADELERWKSEVVCDVLNGVRQIVGEEKTERAINRQQLADLLQISVPTIDRLVSQGAIPSMLVNSRRIFLASEVKEALRQRNTDRAEVKHGKSA